MKLIFLALFVPLPFFTSAQQKDDPVRYNDISFSIGHCQYKDENVHPKVFRGLVFGASYTHSKVAENISEYGAGVKLAAMNTSYEDFPSAAGIYVVAGYKYLVSIANTPHLSYYAGPVADLQYGTNAYFNWDESHFHFANYISGGLSGRIIYNSGNKTFSFNLDLPLLSYIFRSEYNPQYKIDDMTAGGILSNLAGNPEAAFPGRNFMLKTGIEMKYKTRKQKERAVGFNLRYHLMQASHGKPYQNTDNNLTYKLIF